MQFLNVDLFVLVHTNYKTINITTFIGIVAKYLGHGLPRPAPTFYIYRVSSITVACMESREVLSGSPLLSPPCKFLFY